MTVIVKNNKIRQQIASLIHALSYNMPKITKKVAEQIKKQNRSILDFIDVQSENNKNSLVETEKEEESVTKSRQFYKACFKSKVELCGPEKNCHKEKTKLQNKLILLERKLENIDAAYSTCLRICEKKDDQIEQLKAKIQMDAVQPNQNSNTGNNIPSTSKPNAIGLLFESHAHEFHATNLAKLRSINTTKSADSTFVLNAVRSMYSENLPRLLNKSVKGTNKGTPKEALSPKKVKTLESLYFERLSHINLPDEEKDARAKLFNRHIHRAITNINSKTNNENKKMSIDKSN